MNVSITARNKFGVLNENGGFTLPELLIVIAIIGILAAIAVPTFLGQRTKAMRTEAMTNLESIRLLEEQYFAEEGEYTPLAGTLADIPAIQGELPGFKPGDPGELFFTYSITATATAAGASCFQATATGKAGSPVESHVLNVTCENIKNY